jgi:hypothetical protein
VEPDADRWYDSTQVPHDTRWSLDLPDLDGTRRYLNDTLEVTLELLAAAPEDDASLYVYRLALFHEAMHAEAFAYMAQTVGLNQDPVREAEPAVLRAPILFPATRWRLGQPADGPGFVFDNEKWAHEVPIPEFEIDAQAVSWSQFADFVEDGGYDDASHWSAEGWAWVQQSGRRTPRHVEQVRRGAPLRPAGSRACGACGHPRHGARGRGLVPLGGPAPAHRGRMGGRCPPGPFARLALGRCVGVDGHHLSWLGGLLGRPLPRVLAALVRHPPRAARRLVCHAGRVAQPEVPQLLPARARRLLLRFSQLLTLTRLECLPNFMRVRLSC